MAQLRSAAFCFILASLLVLLYVAAAAESKQVVHERLRRQATTKKTTSTKPPTTVKTTTTKTPKTTTVKTTKTTTTKAPKTTTTKTPKTTTVKITTVKTTTVKATPTKAANSTTSVKSTTPGTVDPIETTSSAPSDQTDCTKLNMEAFYICCSRSPLEFFTPAELEQCKPFDPQWVKYVNSYAMYNVEYLHNNNNVDLALITLNDTQMQTSVSQAMDLVYCLLKRKGMIFGNATVNGDLVEPWLLSMTPQASEKQAVWRGCWNHRIVDLGYPGYMHPVTSQLYCVVVAIQALQSQHMEFPQCATVNSPTCVSVMQDFASCTAWQDFYTNLTVVG